MLSLPPLSRGRDRESEWEGAREIVREGESERERGERAEGERERKGRVREREREGEKERGGREMGE